MLDLPPLPAQKVMTKFLLEGNSRLLFSEPGVGKTRATIDANDWLMSDADIEGTLIIAPKRVAVLTWPDELSKWSRHQCADLRTPEGVKAWKTGSSPYYVINIDRIQQFCDTLLKGKKSIPAQSLVLDECHRLKDPMGKRVKELMKHRGLFSRFAGLTGTPTPNSPLDLFSQARLMDGGVSLGKSWTQFRQTYATPDFMGYKWSLNPGADEAIYRRIHHMTLVMRAAEWMDIPPVEVIEIEIPLPDQFRAEYLKLQKESILQTLSGEVVAETAAVLVGKLRQMTSGAVYSSGEETGRSVLPFHDAKTEALRKLHDSIGRKPMLVFIQYDHERDRILKALPWAKLFDETKIDDWNDGKIPMWVAHPASTSEGLNLQKPCGHICWFSGTYSSSEFTQGNARVARTGQTRPTTIYRLVMRGTIDEAVVEATRRKIAGQNAALETLKMLARLEGPAEK